VAGLVLSVDVTAQRAAADRMRLFEAAFAHLNDLVVITEAEPVDAPGPRIVFVNEAFERRTATAAAEVVGRSPRVLQGPGTDPAALARMREALERRVPCREELLNYTKDGEPYWLEVDVAPVTDAGGRVTHFVGRRARRHRAACRRGGAPHQRALRRSLFESSADCVTLLTRDGVVADVNPAGCALLGVDGPRCLLGTPWAADWPAPAATQRAARWRRPSPAGSAASRESTGTPAARCAGGTCR
jgi:PAS domain S-box-containing protein